jgi:lipoyl-dependent peroxiredoxin
MKRTATAIWHGTGKEGKGNITAQSGFLINAPYSASSRFEEAEGTNPEELIAAAHASCFTMKLSFVLTAAGFPSKELETLCTVEIDKGAITSSHLDVKGNVPGISREQFQTCAEDAKANCPVSKVLSTVVTLNAKLI